jgi:hypothetical protein
MKGTIRNFLKDALGVVCVFAIPVVGFYIAYGLGY